MIVTPNLERIWKQRANGKDPGKIELYKSSQGEMEKSYESIIRGVWQGDHRSNIEASGPDGSSPLSSINSSKIDNSSVGFNYFSHR